MPKQLLVGHQNKRGNAIPAPTLQVLHPEAEHSPQRQFLAPPCDNTSQQTTSKEFTASRIPEGKRKKRNTPHFTCVCCTCSDTPYICHMSVCMLLSRDTSETATKVTRVVINSSQGKHTTRKTMPFLRLYFHSPSYSLFGY